ncbi:MAG: M20/M25/M40 family metallo-hydrolase [Acidobacteria bacterium]|nr:M20/M25/M40 family metallo-hydrolase [Acidobacteriota bacterium]
MRPLTLALILGLAVIAPAQSIAAPQKAQATGPVAQLTDEIKAHSEALTNLEYLSDVIGPRLTGSQNLLKAQAWAMGKLKGYGAVNVREEAYEFGPSWSRGTFSARLLTHAGIPLQGAAFGWGATTPGPVRGEVLLPAPQSLEELKALPALAKGKFLLMAGRFPAPKDVDPKLWAEAAAGVQQDLFKNLAGMLIQSNKKDGRLLAVGGPDADHPLHKLPAAFLSTESYMLLKRLAARREKVEIELNIQGTQSAKPVQAHNVIAELRGTEKPDEIIVLGAHLDSWDLGTGTTDNGTGVTAVMEAFRALAAQKVKPKRTIRVVLFSGEEQGLYGSKAYVKAHAAELARHQAVLVEDSGTAPIKGWNLQGREDARALMAKATADANDLGVRELSLETALDSDHAPFLPEGVPAFFARKDFDEYIKVTHHSQVDTFDHAKPEELLQNAQALAATAWGLANLDERLPQVKPLTEPKGTASHGH